MMGINKNLDLDYLYKYFPVSLKIQKEGFLEVPSYPAISLTLPDGKFGLFFRHLSDSAYPFNPDFPKSPVQTCFLGFYFKVTTQASCLFLSVVEDSTKSPITILSYLDNFKNKSEAALKSQQARSLMTRIFTCSKELPYLSNKKIHEIVNTLQKR